MSSAILSVKDLPWLKKSLSGSSPGKGHSVRMLLVGRNEKTPKAFYKNAPATAILASSSAKSLAFHWPVLIFLLPCQRAMERV